MGIPILSVGFFLLPVEMCEGLRFFVSKKGLSANSELLAGNFLEFYRPIISVMNDMNAAVRF